MTDPQTMRAMAGRFDVHAQTVEDEARKMWASSRNIAGAGWSGTAQATSYDTMGQMYTAVELGELLAFLSDWLVSDPNRLDASLHDFAGAPDHAGSAYRVDELRAELDRFARRLLGYDWANGVIGQPS
ncbi:EsaT-6 like protein EsxP [Mycobacterium intracellulare subsp. chimaera]|nr:EsaT-6 like protein EsxP [Mycobacterium intracellulare subsp. chimaera]ASL21303.1 EsaT-6 like protein EsxP [Mycobacterium intracellulare subsp. chimaera]ASQ86414.1 hypothetical protein CE197_13060 [Mycobacterium intracellulare subsp. chimaera]MCA2312176.1 WXG100 family type VII secretion target [Mycobacterium intracellulare subsp. chimaera]MCA2354626.1 WXG100 family type VII secretion target [Mycobacterium intracellulare subsp. chimaera]